MTSGEIFRGGVHLLAFGLASMMLGYNAMKLAEQRDRKHAINAVVYAALMAFEAHHTHEHWGRDA